MAREILHLATPVFSDVGAEVPASAFVQMETYLRLLYRWNLHMNLTAVRDPREMTALHLAECLRCACRVPAAASTLLDYGTGAGLPGIPIQIVRPDLAITLAESQAKKAAFLREAIRELGLNAQVWHGRVDAMGPGHHFDVVTLRAVDKMQEALTDAQGRVAAEGHCMVLTSAAEVSVIQSAMPAFTWRVEPIPATRQRVLMTGGRLS